MRIPPNPNTTKSLHATDKTLLASGYIRVVHGGRGDYIEISRHQVAWKNFSIPPDQKWRVYDPNWTDKIYYVEYRSNGSSYVKLYEQKKTVKYADYKVGMFYISPADVLEHIE